MQKTDTEDDEESIQSSSQNSEADKIKEDPYDIKPEFSDHPPHDTTSFKLDSGEELLFYQRSRFPIHCFLAHTESEVVISKRRIIITQADTIRGIPGIHNLGFQYRMRQHVIARSKVAGYSAGAVQPRCWHLVLGLLFFIVGFLFLAGGDGLLWHSLRALNPMVWMRLLAGQKCRDLGLCGSNDRAGSSLIQLHPEVPITAKTHQLGDVLQHGKQAGTASSGGSFLELRPSGHLLKQHERSKISKAGNFPVLSPGMDGQDSASALLEKENDQAPEGVTPDGCKDFAEWVDSDNSGCSHYTNPKWALSCVGFGAGAGTAHDSSRRFDARRDSTALHLSALEACCVCGGGETVGRNFGIPRLVSALWPAVLAESNSESKAGPSANRISAAGKAALTDAISGLSSEKLKRTALLVAQIRTGEIVAGMLPAPLELQELFVELESQRAIADVRRGLGEQPLPGLTMNALDLDMGDATSQSQNQWWMDFYARLAYFQPHLLCFLKALNLVLVFVGGGLIGKWVMDQRAQDRLYVVLKAHKDYFGSEQDLQQGEKRPFVKDNYKVEQLLGFYLPSLRAHPYRLREMSTALMGPLDDTIESGPAPARTNSLVTSSGATDERQTTHSKVKFTTEDSD